MYLIVLLELLSVTYTMKRVSVALHGLLNLNVFLPENLRFHSAFCQ